MRSKNKSKIKSKKKVYAELVCFPDPDEDNYLHFAVLLDNKKTYVPYEAIPDFIIQFAKEDSVLQEFIIPTDNIIITDTNNDVILRFIELRSLGNAIINSNPTTDEQYQALNRAELFVLNYGFQDLAEVMHNPIFYLGNESKTDSPIELLIYKFLDRIVETSEQEIEELDINPTKTKAKIENDETHDYDEYDDDYDDSDNTPSHISEIIALITELTNPSYKFYHTNKLVF